MPDLWTKCYKMYENVNAFFSEMFRNAEAGTTGCYEMIYRLIYQSDDRTTCIGHLRDGYVTT